VADDFNVLREAVANLKNLREGRIIASVRYNEWVDSERERERVVCGQIADLAEYHSLIVKGGNVESNSVVGGPSNSTIAAPHKPGGPDCRRGTFQCGNLRVVVQEYAGPPPIAAPPPGQVQVAPQSAPTLVRCVQVDLFHSLSVPQPTENTS